MSTANRLPAAPGRQAPAKFPAGAYPSTGAFFGAYAQELMRAAGTVDPAAMDQAAEILLAAHARDATIFSCGNGGSAAIANHLQCDHLKGVRVGTELTPRVVSLSNSSELLTAIANDLGYEEVFSYQLESQSRPGDVVIAVSSSGGSPNIVRALTWAREHGLRTIAITGFTGGQARELAETAIHVDATNYGIIEDLHQAIMHSLAQSVRMSQMAPEAISASIF